MPVEVETLLIDAGKPLLVTVTFCEADAAPTAALRMTGFGVAVKVDELLVPTVRLTCTLTSPAVVCAVIVEEYVPTVRLAPLILTFRLPGLFPLDTKSQFCPTVEVVMLLITIGAPLKVMLTVLGKVPDPTIGMLKLSVG